MKDKTGEYLDKQREFSKGLQSLKSSAVDTVPDFQTSAIKDFPAEKISTLGEIIPQKSESEFLADRLIRDARRAAVEQAGDTLNYNDLRKQFADKAKYAAKSPVGKKILGAVPVLGGLASAAITGDASAAIPILDSAESLGPQPGTLDQRMEQGTLTEKDRQTLAMEQARMRALQNLGR